MKKYKILIVMAMLVIAVGLIAAKPSGITHESSMWVGDKTGSSDFTVTPDDAWIVADFGTGGTIYNTRTESFNIPVTDVYVYGVGVASTTSSPSILAAAIDGIPGLVYGGSTENTSFGHSFIAENNGFTALSFRMFYKTDDSAVSPDSLVFDWAIWVNKSNTNVDAAPFKQTPVTASSTEYKTSNQIMTFTVNATAIAGIDAGDLVTVYFSPDDSRDNSAGTGTATFNKIITGLEGRYSATTF